MSVLPQYAILHPVGCADGCLLFLVYGLMEKLQYRAATARGGVKTLLFSGLALPIVRPWLVHRWSWFGFFRKLPSTAYQSLFAWFF